MRPKERLATFYSLVTSDSPEREFALHRQMFLAEQGYGYDVEDWTPPTATDEGAAIPRGEADIGPIDLVPEPAP